ncbi:MAG TPA: glycoside hydrolase family 3 N-terminal domain-containing protein, partial [Candidatus Limnocylindrales bacterium]
NPDVVIAVDEESGDVTRLEVTSGSTRPGNYALGWVDDAELTEAVAADIGAHLAAAGITMNYAPTVDVNNNPANPVIGVRSFGADPKLVSRHTTAWIKGLQSTGVAACAKHFPGHGDTGVDSHHGLPIIDAELSRLDDVELPPFSAAIDAGVQAIMTAHILVPALDPQRPATMSRAVLVDLLRDRLGFTGLVVTDGIEMASVAQRYGIGRAAVLAVAAGADAICVGGETATEEVAVLLRDTIVDAVTSGELPEERLIEASRRVAALAEVSARGRASRASNGRAWAHTGGTPIGLVAARRALRVTGSARLTRPARLVEFTTSTNLAIDAKTPWGMADALTALRPDTTVARLPEHATLDDVLAESHGRTLVLVCRDLHRYPRMLNLIESVVAARPDSIVVEMGVPASAPAGAGHLATHGAAPVCGQAAAEYLCH